MKFKNSEWTTTLAGWARSFSLAGLIGVLAVGGLVQASTSFGLGERAEGEPTAVAIGAQETDEALAPAEDGRVHVPRWDLPNLHHERVDFWVERFQNDPDMRARFETFLQRSGRYAPFIIEKLREREMPRDLIYLAMIESGFHPAAYSHAHASGMWQFIQETGERYGLSVNRAVDERNDPIRATDAALDYLSDLYDRFGSWYLAAAAYNTGENRVGRLMRTHLRHERARSERDYYLIWPVLPRETRDYVPLMIAAARISKDPARYGFDHVELEAPLRYDEVTVEPATPLKAVADAAGVLLTELRGLNTHLKLDRAPNDRRYAIRLPEGTAESFRDRWTEVRQAESAAPSPAAVEHEVRRGESLWTIARSHGVSVRDLKDVNGMRGDRIQPGQVLQVPAD